MKGKHLEPGHKAPNFVGVDAKGHKIKLSDYKDKYLLVVFLRYTGCPWCNLALHRLSLEHKMLKRDNCEIVAFVQSSQKRTEEDIYHRHELEPKFSIIPDPAKKFYNLYGVQSSRLAAVRSLKAVPDWLHSVRKLGFKQTKVDGDLFLVPAAFLISPHDQKIVKSDYGTSFYEFESFFDIYESVYFKLA